MRGGCLSMKKKVVAITTIALLSSTFSTGALANTYQVQKGDTLTQIAKKHNTSVTQLKTLNKLSSDYLYINQTLKVDATPAVVVTAPVSVAPAPAPIAPVVTAPAMVEPTLTDYTVVQGDTLSKIASKHKISLADLLKWNNLDNHIIFPGQKLKVKNAVVALDKPKPETAPQPSTLSEYVVQKGDTLGHISSKYKMTVAELKSLNKLNSDVIYVGQKLAVAGGATVVLNEAPVENKLVESLVSQAKDWIGVPYSWGGTTLSGFDCSGFIYFAFNAAGTKLSRQSTEGYYSRSYYVDTPQIGDLVFFENTYKAGISHMGIYLGNNTFIHASSSKGVMVSNLSEAYYQQRFDGFKRFY